MKFILMFLLAAITGSSDLAAQQLNNNQTDAVKQLLTAIEQGMKAQMPDAPDAVAERPALLRRIPEYRTLESEIDALWIPAFRNLATVAPTETSQLILVQAAGNMNPENYVNFLNDIASRYEQRSISEALLNRAINPDGKLEYILADNYQNRAVIEFCQRAKRIFANNPQMISMFDAILSGETEKGIADMRRGGGLNLPEIKLAQRGPLLSHTPNVSPLPAATSSPVPANTPSPTAAAPAVETEAPSHTFGIVVGVILVLLVIGGVFAWMRRRG
jgi:hypothetical protein